MVNLELICHSDYLGDQVFLGFNDAKVEGRVVALDDINPVSMKHHTNTCSPTHRCIVIIDRFRFVRVRYGKRCSHMTQLVGYR